MFVHHNVLRNTTAEWLSRTCYDVAIEPSLQPLTAGTIVHQDHTHIHPCQGILQWQSSFGVPP